MWLVIYYFRINGLSKKENQMSYWGTIKIEGCDNWNSCHKWQKVVAWLMAWLWSISLFIKLLPLSTNIYILSSTAFVCWYLAYKFGCIGGIAGNWLRHFLSPLSVRIKNPSAENIMQVKLHWIFHYPLFGICLGGGCAFAICFFAMGVIFAVMRN